VTALGEPLRLGRHQARNRIVFGPHETNLGRRRAFSDRHVAYYAERAAGGAGIVVTEEASVHDSDWPYERAPLASECGPSWAAVADGIHDHGALALAAIGHSGGQGSSAYHQRELWAPSRVPDVTTREVPKAMEKADIAAVVGGFAEAAAAAVASGLDGVEVNAGQWSLLRQFASGLTNQRQDAYGEDRLRLLADVLSAVREAVGDGIVGLRYSIDELAPWAGITPEAGVVALASLLGSRPGLAPRCDYVAVVRGSAYGTGATRPDGHTPPANGRALAALVRAAVAPEIAVIAQGSIVDPSVAEEIVSSGEADAVEMTRAQIADPALAGKATSGRMDLVRPCVLCNQLCLVRDARNPIVSCIGEPRSGHETEEDRAPVSAGTLVRGRAGGPQRLLVVGGGPAGLECARVAALAGIPVTLLERAPVLGGMVTAAVARIPARERFGLLVDWLVAQCHAASVELRTGHEASLEELDAHDGPIVCCTGSRAGRKSYEVVAPASVLAADEVLAAERLPGGRGTGPAVVWDPIGGPIGVGVAALLGALGEPVTLVTPDFVAGEQLARTGDLAPANVRLQQAGVEILKHSTVTRVDMHGVTVEDRFGGGQRVVEGALLVDAGHRLAEDVLYRSAEHAAQRSGLLLVAGDAVAPRTVHEAVLEGRRAAMNVISAGAR
jgi:2,4-dienoyl-CoA reductase (NADPH2)